MKYDKLVRDKIPKILADKGIKATFRIASKEEYAHYLEKKLDEEVAEFHESKSLEELADICEVVWALARLQENEPGFDGLHLADRRSKKNIINGTFSDRVILLEIED